VLARLYLDGLEPSDVSVEVFEGPLETDQRLESGSPIKLELAAREGEGALFRLMHRKPAGSEQLGYTVRVRPTHPDLAHPNEMGLMTWFSREAKRYTAQG